MSDNIYLSKKETGLPFNVVRTVHFRNFKAVFDNDLKYDLSMSDLINIHLLVELRKNTPEIISLSASEEITDPHWIGMPDEFQGLIIRHDGGVWGQYAIQTIWGGYAIVTEDQEWASKHVGETVIVKPEKKFYKTVSIVKKSQQ